MVLWGSRAVSLQFSREEKGFREVKKKGPMTHSHRVAMAGLEGPTPLPPAFTAARRAMGVMGESSPLLSENLQRG